MAPQTVTQTPIVAPDTDISVPTLDQVLDQIIIEAEAARVPCDVQRANRLVGMLERALIHLRALGGHYFIPQTDLDAVHPVLEAIMPDDTPPRDDSAHALLNRLLLGPSEASLVHTMAEGYDHRDHCTVRLDVITMT